MADAAARLRERVAQEGMAVSDRLLANLLAYFELLQRWNRKINLTSLSGLDEAVDRLLVEPLAAAQALPRHSSLGDLGSGGGSPAIPLALALESPELLMVESRSRKAAFLRDAAHEVRLNALVESARFEHVSKQAPYAGRFDLVSIRAVRPDADALLAAASLLKPGGLVALFTGAPTGASTLSLPRNLAWRGTSPLLRSSNSHLTLLFHVEQS
jgi:16S rRNA (guanine527-N7)-methyltransferase